MGDLVDQQSRHQRLSHLDNDSSSQQLLCKSTTPVSLQSTSKQLLPKIVQVSEPQIKSGARTQRSRQQSPGASQR